MNLKKNKEKDRRRARKLADEAWEAVEAGNLDLAEKIIRRAVLAQIDNPVLWYDQGRILLLRGNEDEADRCFRSALRLAPDFAEALSERATLAATRGMHEQAARFMTLAIEVDPDNVAYQSRLADYRLQAEVEHARRLIHVPETPSPEASPPAALSHLSVDWDARVRGIDGEKVRNQLTQQGWCLLPALADRQTCEGLRSLFDEDCWFAKTVRMDRPSFGQGVYRYLRDPVPEIVQSLRRSVYSLVVGVANHWQELLNEEDRFPPTWDEFRALCHSAGQRTPTPILIHYGPGGFNALHQDLRGDIYFPLQLAVVLSPRAEQAKDGEEGFQGGEFLFCDVPERAKSKRHRISAGLGDAILFATRNRLLRIGGVYGLQPVKHGVDPIDSGVRRVLGVPFHEYR